MGSLSKQTLRPGLKATAGGVLADRNTGLVRGTSRAMACAGRPQRFSEAVGALPVEYPIASLLRQVLSGGGDFWGGCDRQPGAGRASARIASDSRPLFERGERSERSEFGRAGPRLVDAAKSAHRADRTSMSPRRAAPAAAARCCLSRTRTSQSRPSEEEKHLKRPPQSPTHPMASGGKTTRTRRPPSVGEASRCSVAPCRSATALTMASPRPLPAEAASGTR